MRWKKDLPPPNCEICGIPCIVFKSGSHWYSSKTCSEEHRKELISRLITERWKDPIRKERMSKRITEYMSDPNRRAEAAEYAKAGWKKNPKARFIHTEEMREKISKANIARGSLDWLKDKDKATKAYEKLSITHKKIYANGGHQQIRTIEVRRKAEELSRLDGLTNPNRGRFETNCHAKDWHLRDRYGREYHFKNLMHFIRNHKHLFSDDQLEIPNPIRHPGRTRVYSGLCMLHPKRKFPATSMYGWTWVLKRNEVDPRLI